MPVSLTCLNLVTLVPQIVVDYYTLLKSAHCSISVVVQRGDVASVLECAGLDLEVE